MCVRAGASGIRWWAYQPETQSRGSTVNTRKSENKWNSSRINKEMEGERKTTTREWGKVRRGCWTEKCRKEKEDKVSPIITSFHQPQIQPCSIPHQFISDGASKPPVWLELRVAYSWISDCTLTESGQGARRRRRRRGKGAKKGEPNGNDGQM